ncbi:L-serine ammonia-lyase [Aestuariibacter sp. GS-14]|uniref:L-serine ammonia-lyase n=1 Tax=Aestuariibacter sp. GS-14 TaxID=2590670 RepID=UPI00112793E3|nr:L-serine ammonia-lyase [Aestuariibacter sp. GS-14]TPV60033.1 L-serine ammonia-lyase [Aestuariibacter sp. GS-14]
MISVFDMFKVGIGPSSSHTVGPMNAAADFAAQLASSQLIHRVTDIKTELFGSLGQTGKGHGSGKAVILGLLGERPDTVNIDTVDALLAEIDAKEQLNLNGQQLIEFPRANAIVFHRRKSLPRHANAMTFRAYENDALLLEQTFYSIGGGFIVRDDQWEQAKQEAHELVAQVPYPFRTAHQLLALCKEHGLSISALMLKNEKALHPHSDIKTRLQQIWMTMDACISRGIDAEGILPGGLKVVRRAPSLHRRLTTEFSSDPMQTLDWVNMFALAVNEENAAGGRVVTAPTNGAAGIIPAVLKYVDKFIRPVDKEIASRFLLTAGAIGILYKENASISGAEVGCQGEVGVACSMAAGALTEVLGGSIQAVENAAEIGMEHNLGLTCDPVGGLVQVPCIERNAMGAIKAINASRLALRGSGEHKVSLDKVIKTMRDTGSDMKTKYKETARGGLAVNIIEC